MENFEDDVIKKKRGRPKNLDLIVDDGKNRKSILNQEYLKRRYAKDEQFRELCKSRRRKYYYLNKK